MVGRDNIVYVFLCLSVQFLCLFYIITVLIYSLKSGVVILKPNRFKHQPYHTNYSYSTVECVLSARANSCYKVHERMSVIINADMPWFELVHHHLLIYDLIGPAWTLFQMYISLFQNAEYPWEPWSSYDSQGISIIDPVTLSWVLLQWIDQDYRCDKTLHLHPCRKALKGTNSPLYSNFVMWSNPLE